MHYASRDREDDEEQPLPPSSPIVGIWWCHHPRNSSGWSRIIYDHHLRLSFANSGVSSTTLPLAHQTTTPKTHQCKNGHRYGGSTTTCNDGPTDTNVATTRAPRQYDTSPRRLGWLTTIAAAGYDEDHPPHASSLS